MRSHFFLFCLLLLLHTSKISQIGSWGEGMHFQLCTCDCDCACACASLPTGIWKCKLSVWNFAFGFCGWRNAVNWRLQLKSYAIGFETKAQWFSGCAYKREIPSQTCCGAIRYQMFGNFLEIFIWDNLGCNQICSKMSIKIRRGWRGEWVWKILSLSCGLFTANIFLVYCYEDIALDFAHQRTLSQWWDRRELIFACVFKRVRGLMHSNYCIIYVVASLFW